MIENSFSQRQGYTKLDQTLVRENLSGAILNSVINGLTCFQDQLSINLNGIINENDFDFMVNEFNLFFLNKSRFEEYLNPIDYIADEKYERYKRIDAIEWLIQYFREWFNSKRDFGILDERKEKSYVWLIKFLNSEFERHNYAYRIVDDLLVEITSNYEIETINKSIEEADKDCVTHLTECLRLLSPGKSKISPRNAIKEAISAVEVIARKITSTNTLDDAFKKLNNIHPMIKKSMQMLYQYTNQKDTGIRHGWMEQENEPSKDEAIFVLVTSCAFINYLMKVYQIS